MDDGGSLSRLKLPQHIDCGSVDLMIDLVYSPANGLKALLVVEPVTEVGAVVGNTGRGMSERDSLGAGEVGLLVGVDSVGVLATEVRQVGVVGGS